MKVFAVLLLASLAAGAPVSQKRFYIYDQPSTHRLADHSHVAFFADEFERSGAAPLPVARYSIASRSVYDKPVIVVVPQEGKEELSAILVDGGLSSLKENPSLRFLHDRLRLGDEQVGVMLGAAKHFPLRQNNMPVSKFYLPEDYKLSKAAELQADFGLVPWMLIAKKSDLEGLNFDKLKVISEYDIQDDKVRVVKDYHTELRNSEAGPALYRLPTSQFAFNAPLAGSLSEGLYQSSSTPAYNPLFRGAVPSAFGVPAYIQKNIYYLQPSSLAGESLDSRFYYHAPANAFVRGDYDLLRQYPFKYYTGDENAAVFDEAITSHIPSRRSNLRVEEINQGISGAHLLADQSGKLVTSQSASLAGANSQVDDAHIATFEKVVTDSSIKYPHFLDSLSNTEAIKTTSSEGRSISGSTEQLTPGNIKTVTTTTITKQSVPSGSYVEADNLGSVKTTKFLTKDISASDVAAWRDINSSQKSTVASTESLPSASSKTVKTTTYVTKTTPEAVITTLIPTSRFETVASLDSIHGETSKDESLAKTSDLSSSSTKTVITSSASDAKDIDSSLTSSVNAADGLSSGSKTIKTTTVVTKELNPASSLEGHILAHDESLAKNSDLSSSSTKTVITSSASDAKDIDSSLRSSVHAADGLSSGSKTIKTTTVVTKQIIPVAAHVGSTILTGDDSSFNAGKLASSGVTKTTFVTSSASDAKDIDSILKSSIIPSESLSSSGSTKTTKTTVFTSSASDAKDIDSILKSSIIPSESLSSSGSTKTTKTTVVTSASDEAQVAKEIDSIVKDSIIPL